MKFLEMRMTGSDYRYYLPLSREANMACELANEKYLRQDQLKMLEIMGCKVESIKDEENSTKYVPIRAPKKVHYIN